MIAREISACSCETCKNMCRRVPCLPTPIDVLRLILAGKKTDLDPVLVYDPIRQVLWPVVRPKYDPDKSACTFFNKEGLCDLHNAGLKPTEGKFAIHTNLDEGLAITVASKWASNIGIDTMRLFPGGEDYIPAMKILMQALKPGSHEGTDPHAPNV